MPRRLPTLGLYAVAVSGLVLALWACASPTSPPAAPRAASSLTGAAFQPPIDLPALTFTRSDGSTFSTTDTRNRMSLFFFGYTHCADVCPLTLAELSQMRRHLGNDAERVDVYFVTLDPARDGPDRMAAYLSNFPGIVGLIGSDAELAAAQSTFQVVAERHDTGDGDYMLDHTAATYLVNADSQIQLAYPYGTSPDDIAADLQRLLPDT
jgi:protein SCO1/2